MSSEDHRTTMGEVLDSSRLAKLANLEANTYVHHTFDHPHLRVKIHEYKTLIPVEEFGKGDSIDDAYVNAHLESIGVCRDLERGLAVIMGDIEAPLYEHSQSFSLPLSGMRMCTDTQGSGHLDLFLPRENRSLKWGNRRFSQLSTPGVMVFAAFLGLVGTSAAMESLDTTALSITTRSSTTRITVRTLVVGAIVIIAPLFQPLIQRAKIIPSLLSKGYASLTVGVIRLRRVIDAIIVATIQSAKSISAPVMTGSSLVFFVLRNDRDLMPQVSWSAFGIWAAATMTYTWIQVDRISRVYCYALACALLVGVAMGVVAVITQQAPLQGGIVTAVPACVAFAVFAPTPFLGDLQTRHDSPA